MAFFIDVIMKEKGLKLLGTINILEETNTVPGNLKEYR